jgi:hypothetical protein
MSDILRQKLAQLEAKRAELDRFRGRLSDAQRLVAQESDRMVTLMGQLSTLLKRETWNNMMGSRTGPFRPGAPGGSQPPQPSMSPSLVNQATAAVDAAIRQADAIQGRLAVIVKDLGAQPAVVRPAPSANGEEELVIDMEPAHPASPAGQIPVAEVVVPPRVPVAATVTAGHSTPAWGKAQSASPAVVAPPPVVVTVTTATAQSVQATPPHPSPTHAPVAEVHTAESQKPSAHADHHEIQSVERPPDSAAGATPLDADDEKAILQAIQTGRKALDSIDLCLESARGATRGGLARSVVGMVRSNGVTRVKLGESRAAARSAAEDIRLLHRQVKELRHRLGEQHMEISQLGALTDQLAAAMPKEDADELHLANVESKTRQTYHEIRAVCSRLQLVAAAVRSRRAAMARGRPKAAVK